MVWFVMRAMLHIQHSLLHVIPEEMQTYVSGVRGFCLHGGECLESECDCTQAVGYNGESCEEAEEECEASDLQCLYGGKCNKQTDPPTCLCRPGYSGVTCAVHGNSIKGTSLADVFNTLCTVN